MTYLLSEPRMSDREKVCAEAWLKAAIDDEDPDQAAYWQRQGLLARQARLGGDGEEIPEPPVPESKRRKAKPTCDLCGSTSCKDSSCLI